ncbi:hypothetical protein, partial [Burkholderia gladioli]|uniref:hypothetical protein n=1 Tax=Burkholderia gladioli TaxID=28095 RepID=UPI00164018A2
MDDPRDRMSWSNLLRGYAGIMQNLANEDCVLNFHLFAIWLLIQGGLKNQVQRFINFWATSSLSIASAGVFQSSVCLGRPFINLA